MERKRPSYRQKAFVSIGHLRNNPILLLPDFVLFITTYILTVIFYRYSGVALLFKTIMVEGTSTEILKSFITNNFLQLAISLSIFIFVTFILGVGMETIKFHMIRQTMLKKHASILKAWKKYRKYFWKIVLMKIIIYLLVLGAIFVIAIFSSLISSLSTRIDFGWLTTLLAFMLFLFFTFGLLFRYAILFFDRKKALETIRSSFLYFKSNSRHTFIVWLITTIVAIIFGLAATFASLFVSKLHVIASAASMVYLVAFITSFVAFGIRVLYTLWSHLFVFENYKN